LLDLLPPGAVIVCAGARQGTEVEVLRNLGFRRAYGIDLNPGPANPLVRYGDFNRIDAPDSSIDLVYSNSVDHAFDLDIFFGEHARVLRADGYALYDLPFGHPGPAGPAESLAWEREDVVVERMLRYFARLLRVETDGSWKWLLFRGVL
jgi:SAM-dependent methyltransferase